jgi:hypothetical protein
MRAAAAKPTIFTPIIRSMFDQNLIIGLVVLAVVVMAIYMYAPKVRAMLMGREGFAGAAGASSGAAGSKKGIATPASNGGMNATGAPQEGKIALAAPSAAKMPAPVAKEGFADYLSGGSADGGMAPVPMAGAQKPAGCYPREQLAPGELLPLDTNSTWAQMNPAGSGDLQGKNFLSAGALVGVNTIGQSLRNANYQLRAEPPNPQMQVGPWQQSTIEPDLQRRPLE